MKTPTVGSLCSGYEGLGLALETVFDGIDLRWVSDIEPGPCALLAARYPEVPNIGDLTTRDWAAVEPVDLLIAGFPCQAVSYAGRRKGQDDERWLWDDVAAAIGVLRPRVVVAENVPGILSLGATRVVADLAALGYVGSTMVVRASDVGACHRRARWFCVATDADERRRDGWGQEEPTAAGNRRERRLRGSEGAGTDAPDAQGVRGDGREFGQRDGEGRRLQAQAGTGSGPAADATEPERGRTQLEGVVTRVGTAELGERPGVASDSYREACSPAWSTSLAVHEPRQEQRSGRRDQVDWGPFAAAIARHERALGRPAPPPTVTRTQLNPLFVEWMMMLPEGWVTGVIKDRLTALKILGNGVVPPQAAYAIRSLLTDLGIDSGQVTA